MSATHTVVISAVARYPLQPNLISVGADEQPETNHTSYETGSGYAFATAVKAVFPKNPAMA